MAGAEPLGQRGGVAVATGTEELDGGLVVSSDDGVELVQTQDGDGIAGQRLQGGAGIATATLGTDDDNAHLGTAMARVKLDEVDNADGLMAVAELYDET